MMMKRAVRSKHEQFFESLKPPLDCRCIVNMSDQFAHWKSEKRKRAAFLVLRNPSAVPP